MVKEEKLNAVEAVTKQLDSSPVIGLLEMYKMSSKQLQKIRKELRGKAVIKMTKKSILAFAMKKSKKDIAKLESIVPNQPALLFTDMEPFKFYAFVSKLKFPTYAKGGDVVKRDVKVSAGPTSLMPGPAISELQKVGIPATVQDGKIAIRSDKVVIKSGEVVSADLSSILRKLKIQPMEVGLNVVAVMKDGEIYAKDVLELVNRLPSMLPQAFQHALNLSVAICYPTKHNIKVLIAKAANYAKAISALAPKEETKKEEVKDLEKKEGEA